MYVLFTVNFNEISNDESDDVQMYINSDYNFLTSYILAVIGISFIPFYLESFGCFSCLLLGQIFTSCKIIE